MDPKLKWFWLALAVVTVVGAAHMFRFAPLVNSEGLPSVDGGLPVWDRWFHRGCLVFIAKDNKRVCAPSDIDEIAKTPWRE